MKLTPMGADKNTQPAQKVRGVIKLKPRLDRPSPYGVQWRAGGQRKKEFFAKEKDRDDRYDRLVRAHTKGTLVNQPSRDEQSAWRAFLTATEGTPWQDVVAGWRAHLQATGRTTCDKLISEAGPEYLLEMQERVNSGDLSPDSFRHKRQTVTLFTDSFGANKLDVPTAIEIEEWIDGLGYESPHTFNSYVRILMAFYNHYKKQVWKNPCDEIEPRNTNNGTIKRSPVADIAKLFVYAQEHHPEALGRLALEAFAGIRFSSAFRLEKKEINFEDKGILLPARKLKTEMRKGRDRYIDELPDNLWPWLEATNDACWAMEATHWMHLKSKLFKDAKVDHPANCLRHSFCTYHIAAFKNPGRTATILCHRDQQKVWDTYNGKATVSEGRAYFGILPC